MAAAFTRILAGLDTAQPFVGRRALERRRGRPYKARLGANECLFGVSTAALRALASGTSELGFYGDPTHTELREAVAKIWSTSLRGVVVAEGIEGLLALFARAFIEPGDVAVTAQGGYPSFDYYVRGCGGALVRPSYADSGRIDLGAMLEAAKRSRAKLVYLANPDNPTGTHIRAHDIRAGLAALPSDCVLLLDEAYAEFAPPIDVLPLGEAHPNMVRLRTFSKAYGLAAARVGYAVSAADLIEPLEHIRQHFAVSKVAQEMALAALGDHEFVAAVLSETARGRDEYAAIANRISATVLPSAANFVAFDFGDSQRAAAVCEWLEEHDVLVRRVTDRPLGRFIRVTVGPPELRSYLGDVLAGCPRG